MLDNLIRPGSLVLLIGLALVAWALVSRTDVNARQGGEHIEIESFAWGISQPQLLRICISNIEGSARPSSSELENISLVFSKIQTEAGDEVLVKELRVPRAQFRCIDFSHAELVAAGLVPEPTSRVQFLVKITSQQRQHKTHTVGATQTVTVGAAQSISVGTGKTETYKTIGTRQTTIIQDL